MFSPFLPNNKTAKAQDLMAGIKSNSVDVSNAVTDKFIKSTQSFSIELFKNSVQEGKNSLISPASVFLALGMTANGANGETLNSFNTVLGKYGMTLDELNKAYKAYSDELTKERGSTSLNIANSIWFRTDFTPKAEFLQNNADYFGAGARALNFSNKSSPDTINSWVKQHTNSKIDKVVNKIDPNDVMYLINTIYFNAKWEKPFDTEHRASKDNFYLSSGSTKTTMFMHLADNMDYIRGQNVSAVLLPYNDGRFAFLCILPDKGINLDEYIKTLNESTIPQLISQKTNTEMALTIPQFKASCDFELNDALKKMGLGIALDGGKADFSKMGNANDNLFISSVKHKTFLQVDELGTEAGAVTSVIMSKGVPTIRQTMIFNRPFIYAIIDTKTNIPLFLGLMENPQS
jgi:serine protease inhibitor